MRKIQKINVNTLSINHLYRYLSGEKKVLLESYDNSSGTGRFSIIARNPIHELKVFQQDLYLDGIKERATDPLARIAEFIQRNQQDVEVLDSPFQGGGIGYVGYDTLAIYERLGDLPPENRAIPDICFYLYESFMVFDHQRSELLLVEDNSYSQRTELELNQDLHRVYTELQRFLTQSSQKITRKKFNLTYKSNVSKTEFMALVEKAKKKIHEGDCFQIVLSQRLEAEFQGDSFAYYEELRLLNPTPYLYYLDFGETKIIGSSPESLVKVQDRTVTTNPIAGTRKRGGTDEEDLQLAEELLKDEKELAEHRMLVDLGRNDIGKISQTGSVTIPTYLTIERFRYVMHIVSIVSGTLKENLTALDALKAVLPAGTVSGAPKLRAMERIYQWENVRRGIYGGAIGYLSLNGDCDFALAIRTMILHQNKAYVQAGAGIVYDSVPETEYLETLQKAKALLEVGL
ncbi:anthranilate synthase component I [Carnobacterium gallinarum]|uniref:anthranilate synthase component I n=1 Tax=Carnobacterium gallinarum TaxID=2749 RepID=UPI000555D503|nr:anthranilate synthase component I [Carnobacterium gallinarum]